MHDRHFEFHLTSTLATIAGCIGVGLVVVNFFVVSDNFGFAGITFVALAATLRIRCWFCRLSQREQAAFEASQRAAHVRSLH